MADKSVGELIAAQSVTPTDLFVLEQNGTAKKLTGQILENWLVSFADGHGGIQSIVKHSASGLVDTYRITLADNTTFDFVVTNGKSINSITKTATSGLVDTYTIQYNDSTAGSFTVTNGEKGDKGDNQYVWIKYASQKPTEDSHSFGDLADNWIGIYSGESNAAPSDWTMYEWFEIKGEKGDTGSPATLVSSKVEYQVGTSGTIIPSGAWSESIPSVPQASYLWTKTTATFNTGDPIVFYSVSRMGVDGLGSVTSVNDVSPDESGNVPLTAENVGALSVGGGTMEGAINMNGQKLFGLNAPTESTEAATRGYTDSAVRKAAPRNLLDNSDFRNPVNQRGLTSLANAGYSVDRWSNFNARGLVELTGEGIAFCNNGANTGLAYFQQNIDENVISHTRDANKIYTIAACINGIIYVGSGTIANELLVSTALGTLVLQYSASSNTMAFRFVTSSTTASVIKWAALYEGEYTLDTIPEYQPKGYGAELAECQRYYQIRSTNNILAVDMRPLMRLTNPTITANPDGYSYSADL